MSEQWKDIPRLPGYQASSFGRIRGPDKKVRQLQKHSSGYPFLAVQFVAHRLICEAFHGPPPFEKAQVLHGPDHSKTNILPDNLRWGTAQENVSDCIESGRAKNLSGEEHGRAILTSDLVKEAREAYDNGENAKSVWRRLGEPLGIKYQGFYKMLRRISWTNQD